MPVPILPLIAIIFGLVGYYISKRPETKEVCKLTYFAGLLVFLAVSIKLVLPL
jgi:hypothetical protein